LNKRINHQPYNKLKGKFKEKELTYKDVAKMLSCSETAISHKMNGISDFSISEAKIIMSAVGVKEDIFFAN